MPAEIIAGEQKQVEVRLEARPASIAGHLLTADGKPVAGATITLRDDAGNPVGSFTTLADGSFGTTGLKPRTYTLQANGQLHRSPGCATSIDLAQSRSVPCPKASVTAGSDPLGRPRVGWFAGARA